MLCVQECVLYVQECVLYVQECVLYVVQECMLNKKNGGNTIDVLS